MQKHWSKVEYLHQSVKNPNIIVKGTKSYYSNARTENFEDYVVRYLYGDAYSLQHWQPQWPIDKLYIGNCVCIGGRNRYPDGRQQHAPQRLVFQLSFYGKNC